MKQGFKIKKRGNLVKRILSLVLALALVLSSNAFTKYEASAAALSNITGRTFFFLGSSVTYGSASGGVSFADYIASRNNCTSVKQAVSGTTLVNNGSSSYVERIKNFDTSAKPDHFICQLSTNDASQNKPLGSLSSSYDLSAFDTTTIIGAIEYIVAYAKNTWGCPVAFYTGTYYDSANYQAMVDALYQVKGKWDIGIIDLWNDPEMRSVSSADYSRYMSDSIHPTAIGYEEWWTPKFEAYLQNFDYSSYDTSGLVEVFGLQVENPSNGMISVVWGNPGNNQLFNVYVDGALAVSSTGATLSNVACAYYTIPSTQGTHTVKVTSTLNGKETAGVSQTINVTGSPAVETTSAPTSDLTGYVTADANWNDLPYWSVYFASGWGNDPTGSYKNGNSYSDFAVYVNRASLAEWGIQMKTQPIAVTNGKEYTCKVTADFNMNMTNTIRFKEENTQTEKLYTLVNGTNTFEITFTANADAAQIFFDLGMLPAGANLKITSFSLAGKEEATTVPETTTEEPTTRTFDAYEIIEAEHFAVNHGGVIDVNGSVSGGHNIGGLSNGVSMQYDNVNFSENAGAIEICYASPTGSTLGNVEVYLDNMNNKIATVELPNNGSSWNTYSVITGELDSNIMAGSHSVYLKFVTTGSLVFVANVDYFRFVKASDLENDNVIIAKEGLEINGYQISATAEGMRTVYSVEDTIDGKEVVASGLVYSLAEYSSLGDMYIGSNNQYVTYFESTENGVCPTSFSSSKTATSYAMTMLFAVKNAAEFNAIWRVRAYAKLSDGTYVYTECEEYQIYDIAEKLYQKELMSYKAAHDYLYINILTVVNPGYAEVEYSMDNILAKW